jgi:hypothetical protein
MGATLFALVAFSLAGTGQSAANERHFSYTYESGVLPPGEREFELWTTYRAGRHDLYVRLDHRAEFEIGLTNRLMTAFYLNWQDVNQEVPTAPSSTQRQFSFEGISSEWKYKLSDPVADGFGSAVYGELGLGTGEVELEGKLILDKGWARTCMPQFHRRTEWEIGMRNGTGGIGVENLALPTSARRLLGWNCATTWNSPRTTSPSTSPVPGPGFHAGETRSATVWAAVGPQEVLSRTRLKAHPRRTQRVNARLLLSPTFEGHGQLPVRLVLVLLGGCAKMPPLSPAQIEGRAAVARHGGRTSRKRGLHVIRCSGCHNLFCDGEGAGEWGTDPPKMAERAKLTRQRGRSQRPPREGRPMTRICITGGAVLASAAVADRTFSTGVTEGRDPATLDGRYGESRPGYGVMIFVTEDLHRDTFIKVESSGVPQDDRVYTLKLNNVLKFDTGIYDYSVMSSVFSAVNGPHHAFELCALPTSRNNGFSRRSRGGHLEN